jgi:hypothetical protein
MCPRSAPDLRRARVRSAKWPRHLSALQSALYASVRGRHRRESSSRVSRARRSCVGATEPRLVGAALSGSCARTVVIYGGVCANAHPTEQTPSHRRWQRQMCSPFGRFFPMKTRFRSTARHCARRRSNLIRSHGRRWRAASVLSDAERFGGLEADDQNELLRPLDRQVTRLGALQYLGHISPASPIQLQNVHPISQEPPAFGKSRKKEMRAMRLA